MPPHDPLRTHTPRVLRPTPSSTKQQSQNLKPHLLVASAWPPECTVLLAIVQQGAHITQCVHTMSPPPHTHTGFTPAVPFLHLRSTYAYAVRWPRSYTARHTLVPPPTLTMLWLVCTVYGRLMCVYVRWGGMGMGEQLEATSGRLQQGRALSTSPRTEREASAMRARTAQTIYNKAPP